MLNIAVADDGDPSSKSKTIVKCRCCCREIGKMKKKIKREEKREWET